MRDSDSVPHHFFEDSVTDGLTALMALLAVAGFFTNVIILIIFLKIYGSKRVQGILWMNLSVCLLVQSLLLFVSAMGNKVESLSSSSHMCRLRYALPIVMDLATMGCYSNLLMERILALHFPTFHSFTTKIDTVMILHGWCYGLAFMASITVGYQTYDPSTRCVTPYINQTPQESVTFLTFWLVVFFLLIALVCLLFTDTNGMSKAETMRIQMETKGASVVVTLGLLFVLVWVPKQLVCLFYWTDSVGPIMFQVQSNLTNLLFRSGVIMPFLVLLTAVEFRSAFFSLMTCNSMDQIRRRIRNQENYSDTIQKMVLFERQRRSADKASLSISFRSMTERPPSTDTAPSPAPTPATLPRVELEPKKDVSLSTIVNDEAQIGNRGSTMFLKRHET